MRFFNLDTELELDGIADFLPDWMNDQKEVIVVFSPHDDDALLGAGYAILSALNNDADVYIVIFHSGNAGYSDLNHKKDIVEIRKKETINALKVIGIDESHILRLEIPDFSGNNYFGWFNPLKNSKHVASGTFEPLIKKLREIRTTRLLFANGYREHIDHRAVEDTAIYYGPQVGDPICIDWGEPIKISSFMRYAVWGRFKSSAEFALIADKKEEKLIENAIKKWDSQQKIIENILEKRKERKVENLGYIELYQPVDPRPQMDFEPYKEKIRDLQ